MWGWRKPALPLDLREKVWTELCMSWLADQFGRERLLAGPTVTPTADFFPEPLDGRELNVQRAFDRVCYFMGLEPGEVSLEIVEQTDLVADEPTDPHVRVQAPSKGDAAPFIANSSKGVARYKLGRLPSAATIDDASWPFLCDLLPTLFGLGIFPANVVMSEYYETIVPHYSFWQMQRHGHLPLHVHGYALALMAWNRGERKPSWTRHLRLDVRAAFDKGLRYLEAAGDALLSPQQRATDRARRPTAVIIQQLSQGSATEQLASLWQLQCQNPTLPPAAHGPTQALLNSTEPALRVEAAIALARTGETFPDAVDPLLEMLQEQAGDARLAAALSLGSVAPSSPAVVAELASVVGREDDPQIVAAAAASLRQLGATDARGATAILPRLRRSLLTGKGADPAVLAAALCVLHNDPAALVQQERGTDDDESWDQVLMLVRAVDAGETPAPDSDDADEDEDPPSPQRIGDYGLLPLLVPSREREVPARWIFA